MGRLHHVNLSIPVGGESDEAAFLTAMLGYRRLTPPADLSIAKWFEFADGTQVHLSENPEHSPSPSAHVAMEVGPEIDAVAERLTAAGYEVNRLERPEARLLFVLDPAGNRWELRDPVLQ